MLPSIVLTASAVATARTRPRGSRAAVCLAHHVKGGVFADLERLRHVLDKKQVHSAELV